MGEKQHIISAWLSDERVMQYMIQDIIEYHKHKEKIPRQLELF